MHRQVTSDGAHIAVHDLGGEGHPLLFSHATGFHGMVWAALAVRLKAAFRCLSFDLRGHGDSRPAPGDDLDWNGFGRDVLAVVDGHGLERPVGVGHSSGATALILAEQARPGTFRSLYLYEPVLVRADPPLGPDRGSWLAAAARKRREVFGSRREAVDNYATKPPLSTLDPAVLDTYVAHGFEDLADGTVRLKCRGETEAQVYEMATDNDSFVRLGEIGCPVTVAAGALSDAFPAGVMEMVAARLARSHTEVLPGLGHLGPLEDPAAVADSVRRSLLGQIPGR